MEVRLVQTCDDTVYIDMLNLTKRTAKIYSARAGCTYQQVIGLKRGFYPWHATFNRISIFKEALEEGFGGWMIYLDADAFINDLDFPIHEYLRSKASSLMVARAVFPERCPTWDINAGVLMINFAHRDTNRFINTYYDAFMSISETALRGARRFHDIIDDQQMLHSILQEDAGLVEGIFFESPWVINSEGASFIRQILRSNVREGFDARLHRIKAETDRIVSKASLR